VREGTSEVDLMRMMKTGLNYLRAWSHVHVKDATNRPVERIEVRKAGRSRLAGKPWKPDLAPVRTEPRALERQMAIGLKCGEKTFSRLRRPPMVWFM
jgi:hypothetical protein